MLPPGGRNWQLISPNRNNFYMFRVALAKVDKQAVVADVFAPFGLFA